MITLQWVDYHQEQQGQDLLSLLNSYAMDPMGGGEALDSKVQQHLIAKLAERSDTFSVIAYENDQPIGLVNCVEGFSTFAAKPVMNIHDVVVLPTHRGKGISMLLLNEVEQLARQRDCCKLTLEVLQGNKVAKASYLKFGFAGYELNPEMGQAMFWQKKL